MGTRIRKFIDFIKEEFVLVGPMGPGYGETRLQNKTVNSHDTAVIFCDLDSKFYTIDDYNNIYGEYLKNGGKPLDGFSIENIVVILNYSS